MKCLSNQEFHRFLPSFMNVMIMAYIRIARYICTYAVCFIGNCRIQITQFLVPSTFCVFLFFVVKIFYVRGLVSTGAVGASAPMIFQVVGASKTNVCGFLPVVYKNLTKSLLFSFVVEHNQSFPMYFSEYGNPRIWLFFAEIHTLTYFALITLSVQNCTFEPWFVAT